MSERTRATGMEIIRRAMALGEGLDAYDPAIDPVLFEAAAELAAMAGDADLLRDLAGRHPDDDRPMWGDLLLLAAVRLETGR